MLMFAQVEAKLVAIAVPWVSKKHSLSKVHKSFFNIKPIDCKIYSMLSLGCMSFFKTLLKNTSLVPVQKCMV